MCVFSVLNFFGVELESFQSTSNQLFPNQINLRSASFYVGLIYFSLSRLSLTRRYPNEMLTMMLTVFRSSINLIVLNRFCICHTVHKVKSSCFSLNRRSLVCGGCAAQDTLKRGQMISLAFGMEYWFVGFGGLSADY